MRAPGEIRTVKKWGAMNRSTANTQTGGKMRVGKTRDVGVRRRTNEGKTQAVVKRDTWKMGEAVKLRIVKKSAVTKTSDMRI
eukprot:1038710-Pleurochrysis_carterae.AAC.1